MVNAVSLRPVSLLTLTLALGCTGELAGPSPPLPGGAPVTADPMPLGDPACATPQPGRSPLRRLTRDEYDRTLTDLLDDTTGPGARLLTADAAHDNADVRTVGPLLAEQYFIAAEEIAKRAVTARGGALACDAAALGEAACAAQIIEVLGARAYRRPLPQADRAHWQGVFDKARLQLDYTESLEVVVAAMLQAPRFLYRIETAASPGVQRLDGYSLASRLSYLFWGTLPDESLLAAAAAGTLDSDAGVLAEAQRLLSDGRASQFYASFFDRFLELEQLNEVVKDAQLFPSFTPEIPELLREETRQFVSSVMATDGGFHSLLTANYSMLNPALAGFYGVTAAPGSGFARVELDPLKSSGLLTHGSLLATHAKPHETSPIHRGMFVQASLLCGTVPPPPDDLEVVAPDPDPTLTTRQRFSEHRANPACAGCHQLLDPIGLAFEHYDAVGRYRETENGLPIDASGELFSTDVDGHFNGPRELAEKLLGSAQVTACFSNHWFRFAQARREAPEDHCSIAKLTSAFTASSLDTRQLALALTQTDAFLYKQFDDPGAAAGGMP
jgi:hypothetical protein